MAAKRAPKTAKSQKVFGHSGKRTQVRSVNRLPPLEIVLEVRGTGYACQFPCCCSTDRAVDYLGRAQIISRRFTIVMLECQSF